MNQEILDEIVVRGLRDDVQLPELASLLVMRGHNRDETALREAVLQVVKELLVRGWVRLGDLSGTGERIDFEPWSGSIDEALLRLAGRLGEQGWLSYLGVAWLRTTPAGDERASQFMSLEWSAAKDLIRTSHGGMIPFASIVEAAQETFAPCDESELLQRVASLVFLMIARDLAYLVVPCETTETLRTAAGSRLSAEEASRAIRDRYSKPHWIECIDSGPALVVTDEGRALCQTDSSSGSGSS